MLVESRLKMNMRSAVESTRNEEKKTCSHLQPNANAHHFKLAPHIHKRENHAWKIVAMYHLL